MQAVQDELATTGTPAWENDSMVVWTENNRGAWVLTALRDGTCVLGDAAVLCDADIAFFHRGLLP